MPFSGSVCSIHSEKNFTFCRGKILVACISLTKVKMMEDPINENLLNRFLDRDTTEQENDEILQWVSCSESNRVRFREIHHTYQLSKFRQYRSETDVDEAWNKISNRLPREADDRRLVYLDVFRKIAASAIIILGVGFGGWWMNGHFHKGIKSAVVQFEAPKGEKSRVVLADGSLVWLNSQTTLKYDALNPRKVTLDGEAYFEVDKDRKHPFEVVTVSGMKVVVTGTRFNLRCLESEPYVETTLEEGEVMIRGDKDNQLAVLKPGQQAQYDTKTKEVRVQEVTPDDYSLWKNNELRFSDVSFAELAPRIERWYGVTVKLDPKISSTDRFTMTIKTESLRELLNMMQLTSKFNYKIEGVQVEIFAK